jgi:hypothetical protein
VKQTVSRPHAWWRAEKFVLKKMYAQGAEVVEQLTKEVRIPRCLLAPSM